MRNEIKGLGETLLGETWCSQPKCLSVVFVWGCHSFIHVVCGVVWCPAVSWGVMRYLVFIPSSVPARVMVYFSLRNSYTESTTQVEPCAKPPLALCYVGTISNSHIFKNMHYRSKWLSECYRCVQEVKIRKLGLTLTINLTSLNFVG